MPTLFRIFFPLFFYQMVTAVLTEVIPSSFSLLFCTGISAFLCIPALYFWERSGLGSVLKKERFETEHFFVPFSKQIPCLILFSFSVCIFFNSFFLFPFVRECFETDSALVSDVLYDPPLWEQILFTGCSIPVAEELIFRGQIFTVLRQKQQFLSASFFSALFFGIYHMNLPQGIYAFCLALMMNWIYERFETIKAPCLFHSIANLLSVFITFFIRQNLVHPSVAGLMAGMFVSFAGMLFCIRCIHRSGTESEKHLV